MFFGVQGLHNLLDTPVIRDNPLRVACLVAMAVGLILSFALGSPWFVPAIFFAAGLVVAFPLGRDPLILDNKA